MIIKTPHQHISANQEKVYNFLMDMNNFKELLPQDKISEWEATNETCSVKVQNTGHLGLKRVASTPHSLVYLDSFGKTPFKFTLNLFIDKIDDNATEVHLIFDGALNPFMKMMVEKPLTHFFNEFIKKLATISF